MFRCRLWHLQSAPRLGPGHGAATKGARPWARPGYGGGAAGPVHPGYWWRSRACPYPEPQHAACQRARDEARCPADLAPSRPGASGARGPGLGPPGFGPSPRFADPQLWRRTPGGQAFGQPCGPGRTCPSCGAEQTEGRASGGGGLRAAAWGLSRSRAGAGPKLRLKLGPWREEALRRHGDRPAGRRLRRRALVRRRSALLVRRRGNDREPARGGETPDADATQRPARARAELAVAVRPRRHPSRAD
jgi:hypothetical protein